MGGHPFQAIPCNICSKPVEWRLDADENGKAVHEDCYVKHATSSRSDVLATMMAD